MERHEAVDWLIKEDYLKATQACRVMKLSRSSWYRGPADSSARDTPVIDRLNEVIGKHGQWGFRNCYHWLRQRGEPWNHKRVLRVYRSMGLNLPRRAKRRLPARIIQPLDVPAVAGRMWSIDFMHDTPLLQQTLQDAQHHR